MTYFWKKVIFIYPPSFRSVVNNTLEGMENIISVSMPTCPWQYFLLRQPLVVVKKLLKGFHRLVSLQSAHFHIWKLPLDWLFHCVEVALFSRVLRSCSIRLVLSQISLVSDVWPMETLNNLGGQEWKQNECMVGTIGWGWGSDRVGMGVR